MKSLVAALCLLSAAVLVMTTYYALRLEEFGVLIEEEMTCEPPAAIFFMKIHKCASSSVQNLLLRLGERLRLEVAMPRRGNYFGHPRPFRADMVDRPAGSGNVSRRLLVHHMRMDPPEVAKVVGESAVWLTVLRRPVDQFISMFEYYGLEEVWNISLAEFAAAPPGLLPPVDNATHFVPNQMTFDLGYDVKILQEDDQLQGAMLESVQRQFDVVLLTDLLDESLVLLRHRLCLDWDDVVAFRHNVRPPRLRSDAARNASLRRQLRHHLAADGALYHHFYRRLRQALRQLGEEHVQRGKAALRRRVLHWADRCRGWRWNWPGEPVPLPPPPPPGSSGSSGSARDVWMCSRLFAHELTYTDHLRDQQRRRAAVALAKAQRAARAQREAAALADVE